MLLRIFSIHDCLARCVAVPDPEDDLSRFVLLHAGDVLAADIGYVERSRPRPPEHQCGVGSAEPE